MDKNLLMRVYKKYSPVLIFRDRISARWKFGGYDYTYCYYPPVVHSISRYKKPSSDKPSEFSWIELGWKSCLNPTRESRLLSVHHSFLKDVECPACGRWGTKNPHRESCRLITSLQG